MAGLVVLGVVLFCVGAGIATSRFVVHIAKMVRKPLRRRKLCKCRKISFLLFTAVLLVIVFRQKKSSLFNFYVEMLASHLHNSLFSL